MKRQGEIEMKQRRTRVLEAAADVFFRYGYARATLGDVAQKAGIHRPALYSLFPEGKDELFEAVLLHLVGTEVEQYRKEIAGIASLRERLLYCVERWSMGGFRLTDTHPDARDAFDMTYPAVKKMYAVLALFYAELLEQAVAASTLNITAEQFARLLIFSLRGVKDMATDAESMRVLLTLEVDLFLTALSPFTPQ